jgi:nicotinate-nucleotide adenylyltransferase
MPRQSAPVRFGSLRVKTPLVAPGLRIGVMGGSFNPPHEGHAIVAITAMKRLRLDQVWWLVTPGNPLKTNSSLAPLDARMAACRALAKGPRMRVTAFEAQLQTPYTAATLDFLQLRYPTVTFVWIMGADNLAGFHRWQHWRDIARHMAIAVVDRPGWRMAALSSKAAQSLAKRRLPEAGAATMAARRKIRWTLLSTRLSHASSTHLRSLAQSIPRPGGA